jgi:hypothetical protein
VSETSFVGSFGDAADAVVRALESDPRVTSVNAPDKIEDEWSVPWKVLPSPADRTGLITGNDALHGLRFSDPIRFSVDVPEKNQRRVLDTDEVPRRYQAVWDGVILLVTWTMSTDASMPMSGGHVVSEILSDATKNAGYDLYVQACNAACDYEFAHTSLRFRRRKSGEDVEYLESKYFSEVEALVPEGDDPIEEVFWDLSRLAFEFTHLKNLGRRILEIEGDGRSAVSRLLAIDVERSELALAGPWQRIRSAWGLRGWRRASRREIARVWAALANIELLTRQWDSIRFPFEQESKERGRDSLFRRDYADEVDRVASFNPEVLRASVQESAIRLDNKALFLVTGMGAVAGAVAGGIVGAIVGS